MSEATTDRELLEMAAKAFWADEIDDVCSIRWLELDQAIGYTHGDNQDHNGQDREFVWNPLADDGDALRLAVKLAIDIRLFGSSISGWCLSSEKPWVGTLVDRMGRGFNELCGEDPAAATRRAITRAAAEIGRAMK